MQSANVDGPVLDIPFFRSVRGKLALLLVSVVAVTILALSVSHYIFVRTTVSEDIHRELQLHVEALREVVSAHVSHQYERAALVASRTRLRELLGEFSRGETSQAALQAQGGRILRDAMQSTEGFQRIRIASESGRIILSTEAADLGTDVADLVEFRAGREARRFDLPLGSAHEPGVVALPIRTNDGVGLGVVLVDLDVQRLVAMFSGIRTGHESSRVRLGLDDQEGSIRYFYASVEQAAPAGVSTPAPAIDVPMRAAVNGETGFTEVTDSRGIRVLAAYVSLTDLEWGLVSQVDASEAYAALGRTRNVVIGISLGFFALVAVAGIMIAVRFLAPIVRLSEATGRVARGGMQTRVPIESRDEIGVLTRTFNAMSETVQRHRNQLEEIVLERTAKLESSRDQLAELCRVLEEQADLIERDLRRAEVIHRSLLPRHPPHMDGFRVVSLYIPGHNVGGDLYDVVNIDGRFVAMFVADAAGHGVSAAMLAVLFKQRLETVDAKRQALSPSVALSNVNEALVEDISAPGVFVTAAYCLLDTQTRELTISSAGHPPMLVAKQTGEFELVEHTGPALGLYEDAVFAERRINLAQGDRVLIYTDGLFDVTGSDPQRLEDVAKTLADDTNNLSVLNRILSGASGGQEMADRDDVTLLLFDTEAGASRFEKRDEVGTAVVAESHRDSIDHWTLSYAETATTTFIFLSGRVTWIYGQALFDAAIVVIEAHRDLVIDLSECTSLDSATSGTLHELVEVAAHRSSQLSMQGASESLLRTFMELGMNDVLGCMTESPTALPANRHPVETGPSDPRSQQLRLLKAHEILADLNVENREEFEAVVQELRDDITQRAGGG